MLITIKDCKFVYICHPGKTEQTKTIIAISHSPSIRKEIL